MRSLGAAAGAGAGTEVDAGAGSGLAEEAAQTAGCDPFVLSSAAALEEVISDPFDAPAAMPSQLGRLLSDAEAGCGD